MRRAKVSLSFCRETGHPLVYSPWDSHRDPHWTLTTLRTPQISVHSADVKNVLRVFSIEVPAREKDDLNEDPIVIRLRKVCSYPSWRKK